jgi:pyrroloquinoline quinone biosynthesis protein D
MFFSLSIQVFARQVSYNTAEHSANCGIATGSGDRVAEELIAGDAKPRLPRGVRLTHSEAQDGWVLLAPERIFKADAIAFEILRHCAGEAILVAVVDDPAAIFKAPRERILTDARKLLSGLAEKKPLEL